MSLDACPSDAELLALKAARERQAGKRSTATNRLVPSPEQLKRAKQQALAKRRVVGFRLMCREIGIPLPVEEYRFAAPERQWRADFAWPDERVLLEVEGGVWLAGGGRHNRGAGYLQDLEKYNAATLRGFRVFRVTPQQLCTLSTAAMIRAALTPSQEHAA